MRDALVHLLVDVLVQVVDVLADQTDILVHVIYGALNLDRVLNFTLDLHLRSLFLFYIME